MTTATTRQNIRRAIMDRIPELGFYGTASAVATTSITDATYLQSSNFGPREFSGNWIYRPDLTGDDLVKQATTLSTATLSHGGSNYSDTSDTKYELHKLLHPEELNACITRAMERIYFHTMVPITMVADGDMDASNTTSWTGSSGTTLSKVTTASRVFAGLRALRVQNDSANDYAESSSIRVYEGDRFYASAVVHADVGTPILRVWDATNSATIGTAVTPSQARYEGFIHLWIDEEVPSGCELVTLRLEGEESNADLYWSHAVFQNNEQRYFDAPTWLDDYYKFVSLREACYKNNLESATSGGIDDATSRVWRDWNQPAHYNLTLQNLEANPYRIELYKPLPQNEMWVMGKRPWSDSEALSTDAATTLAPLRQVYAYATNEIAKVLRMRYPHDQRWQELHNLSMADVQAETATRPEPPLRPYRHNYKGRV